MHVYVHVLWFEDAQTLPSSVWISCLVAIFMQMLYDPCDLSHGRVQSRVKQQRELFLSHLSDVTLEAPLKAQLDLWNGWHGSPCITALQKDGETWKSASAFASFPLHSPPPSLIPDKSMVLENAPRHIKQSPRLSGALSASLWHLIGCCAARQQDSPGGWITGRGQGWIWKDMHRDLWHGGVVLIDYPRLYHTDCESVWCIHGAENTVIYWSEGTVFCYRIKHI